MLRFSEYQNDTIDLTIDFYGYEDCPANYAFGPAIHSNYVLHYITKGKGKFHYAGQVHDLEAGDLFLLKPNELTYYQADSDQPWSYYWFGISGVKAKEYFELSTLGETAVLHHNHDSHRLIEPMKNAFQTAGYDYQDSQHFLHLLSKLYEFFYLLNRYFPNTNKKEVHPSQKLYLKAKKMIDTNYDDMELSVSSIAQMLNVNRSYLTTVFKNFHQLSPKEYINQVRMQRACELLKNTQEPIKIIAYSVGYLDPLHFSKAFKKYYQCSPTDYRSQPSH